MAFLWDQSGRDDDILARAIALATIPSQFVELKEEYRQELHRIEIRSGLGLFAGDLELYDEFHS